MFKQHRKLKLNTHTHGQDTAAKRQHPLQKNTTKEKTNQLNSYSSIAKKNHKESEIQT